MHYLIQLIRMWRVRRMIPALAAQARVNVAKIGTFSSRYMGRRKR